MLHIYPPVHRQPMHSAPVLSVAARELCGNVWPPHLALQSCGRAQRGLCLHYQVDIDTCRSCCSSCAIRLLPGGGQVHRGQVSSTAHTPKCAFECMGSGFKTRPCFAAARLKLREIRTQDLSCRDCCSWDECCRCGCHCFIKLVTALALCLRTSSAPGRRERLPLSAMRG